MCGKSESGDVTKVELRKMPQPPLGKKRKFDFETHAAAALNMNLNRVLKAQSLLANRKTSFKLGWWTLNLNLPSD